MHEHFGREWPVVQGIQQRLIDEIEKSFIEFAAAGAIEKHARLFPEVRFSGCVDAVELLETSLPLQLRQRLPNWFPNEFAIAEEMLIRRIDEIDDVIATAQNADQCRCVNEERVEIVAGRMARRFVSPRG